MNKINNQQNFLKKQAINAFNNIFDREGKVNKIKAEQFGVIKFVKDGMTQQEYKTACENNEIG